MNISFLFPLAGAALQATSFTLDKVALSLRQVGAKTYLAVSFPLIFLIDLVLFFIIRPPFSRELLLGYGGVLVLTSCALILVTNLLFYRALDEDNLGEIETLDLVRNIPIILFASIVFTDERNFFLVIPALVASIAIVWSHWKRHHVAIARKTLPFLIWSLAAAPAGAALSKILLGAWHPLSLELVRSGILALIIGFWFAKSAQRVSQKAFLLLLATNILTGLAHVLLAASYQQLGIVYTTLIFLLQPLLVYGASILFLGERPQWRKTLGFAIVLTSLAAARALA